jgi:predicted RNA-binding protein with PUA-like domain
MAYWLLKTDPDTYSYENLELDKKTVWDGVANNLALIHMREMRKGDLALIYHSGDEKCIVGIAEIASDPYPDPKEDNPKLVVVDVKSRKRLPRTIPLSEIKANKAFQDFVLIKIGRLSVMPVTDKQWEQLGV